MSELKPTEEQALYAKVLAVLANIGFVLMIAGFIVYVIGVGSPIPVNEVPKYWGSMRAGEFKGVIYVAGQASKDNKSLLNFAINSMEIIPNEVKAEQFENEIKKKLSNDDDKKIIEEFYKKEKEQFKLDTGHLKEKDKVKIASILKSIGYRDLQKLPNNLPAEIKKKINFDKGMMVFDGAMNKAEYKKLLKVIEDSPDEKKHSKWIEAFNSRSENVIVEYKYTLQDASGKEEEKLDKVVKDNIPGGWGWMGLLGTGDWAGFIGLIFLAGVTIVCYLVILPVLFRKKDYVCGVIAVVQVIVLVLAASGFISGGH